MRRWCCRVGGFVGRDGVFRYHSLRLAGSNCTEPRNTPHGHFHDPEREWPQSIHEVRCTKHDPGASVRRFSAMGGAVRKADPFARKPDLHIVNINRASDPTHMQADGCERRCCDAARQAVSRGMTRGRPAAAARFGVEDAWCRRVQEEEGAAALIGAVEHALVHSLSPAMSREKSVAGHEAAAGPVPQVARNPSRRQHTTCTPPPCRSPLLAISRPRTFCGPSKPPATSSTLLLRRQRRKMGKA